MAVDNLFFPSPAMQLRAEQACGWIQAPAAPKTGIKQRSLPNLWITVHLCQNYPQVCSLGRCGRWKSMPDRVAGAGL